VFAGKPFLQPSPNGDEIYYQNVTIRGETRQWGMSWSAFRHLVNQLGDDDEAWPDTTVQFRRSQVETRRGIVFALLADVIKGDRRLPTQPQPSTAKKGVATPADLDQTGGDEKKDMRLQYACPSQCGYRTTSIAELGKHVADCDKVKRLETELPSRRRDE
jgi:hypothetical protein